MNIIWQRPDGGVSVTALSPEAITRMAWANENAGLLAQKATLTAEAETLEADMSALSVVFNAEKEKLEAAYGNDEAVYLGALGKAREADAAMSVKRARAAEVADALRTIAAVEEVRDTIGLDEHAHETILLARGDIPADQVCVGHSVDVPSDRTFRNAWTWNGKVDHDMEKCRAIHRDRMRAARAPKLAALDIKQLRGEDVEAEKAALRDVTADPAIDAAKTPEELKAVWPEALA